ncbi:hypothetical protein BH20ACT2_BH20ACT2_18210 [soil metagenome]
MITITPADLHLEVRVDEELVAESDRPVLLDETRLSTHYGASTTTVSTSLSKAGSR